MTDPAAPLVIDRHDLDMAILALHAYNIGANVHLNLPAGGSAQISTQIGDFKPVNVFGTSSNVYQLPDGFVAGAYSRAGKAIITIRGTNPDELAGVDGLKGYGLAVGLGIDSSPQAEDALAIYKELLDQAGLSLFDNNVALVGHSLGGGLAGYIAALYGREATLFDTMAFRSSVVNDYQNATIGKSERDKEGNEHLLPADSDLKSRLYGDENPRSPDFTNIMHHYTAGEPLVISRIGQSVPEDSLDAHWGLSPSLNLRKISLHSIALQVDLQWAKLFAERDWSAGGDAIWNAYFGDQVAAKISGLADMKGEKSDISTVLQDAIAYSAVSGEVQPFGDSALPAMFDDAADIGFGITMSNAVSGNFGAYTTLLGDIAVEYAGRLAVSKTFQGDAPSAKAGTLSIRGGTVSAENAIQLDLSRDRWTFGGDYQASGFKADIINTTINTNVGGEDAFSAFTQYGAIANLGGYADVVDHIGGILFQVGNPSLPLDLVYSKPQLSLVVLGTQSIGADIGERSDDGSAVIVLGSASDEVLIGSAQNDVLMGGGGADTISGRGGNNVLFGGAGKDIIHATGQYDYVDGGHGDDVIFATGQSATINFGEGDGKDVVKTGDGEYQLMLDNLSLKDVSFIAGGSDIYSGGIWTDLNTISIKINATGEKITFIKDAPSNEFFDGTRARNGVRISHGELVESTLSNSPISSIRFADGSTWSAKDIWSHVAGWQNNKDVYFDLFQNMDHYQLIPKNRIVRASDMRSSSLQTMQGGAAVDANQSKYAPQEGSLAVISNNPKGYIDHLNSEYFSLSPLSYPMGKAVEGTSGSDYLSSGYGDDTLTGGKGDDTYFLGFGNDTIVWNIGDGNDTAFGAGAYKGNDRLVLGDGINPADLRFAATLDGAGLIISFANAEGSVTLSQEVAASADRGAFSVAFSNGTVWSHRDLLAAASMAIASAHRTVNGSDKAENLYLPQTNFTAHAGGGDDRLFVSGDGSGVVTFTKGDGHDRLTSQTADSLRNDSLQLDNILPSDVNISRDGDAMVVTINATGDSFTVDNQFALTTDGAVEGVSSISFADGTTWDRSTFAAHIVSVETIMGTSDDDALRLPANYVRVDPGRGNDYIAVSGDGGGQILFRGGDGHDILDNPGSGFVRSDTLVLVGLNPSDVSLTRSGDQMSVTVLSTGAVFDAQSQFWQGEGSKGLGYIRFADGTIWDRASFETKVAQAGLVAGTPNEDFLILASDYVRVDPGRGDDRIQVSGNGGGEILFRADSGHDILENPGSGYSRYDTLNLIGLTPEDVAISRSGERLSVVVLSTGATFDAAQQFRVDDGTYGLSYIKFADGTILYRSDISRIGIKLTANPGNDVVHVAGLHASGSLGEGEDFIDFTNTTGPSHVDGGAGSDMFSLSDNSYNILNGGDGADYFVMLGASRADIEGGAGNDLYDFSSHQSGDDNSSSLIFHSGFGNDTLRTSDDDGYARTSGGRALSHWHVNNFDFTDIDPADITIVWDPTVWHTGENLYYGYGEAAIITSTGDSIHIGGVNGFWTGGDGTHFNPDTVELDMPRINNVAVKSGATAISFLQGGVSQYLSYPGTSAPEHWQNMEKSDKSAAGNMSTTEGNSMAVVHYSAFPATDAAMNHNSSDYVAIAPEAFEQCIAVIA